jgi:hypothetical protein
MIPHDEFLARIHDHACGTLTGPEREAWESHRRECTDCRRISERWPTSSEVPDLWPGIRGRLQLPAPAHFRGALWKTWTLAGFCGMALILAASAFHHPERSWSLADASYSDTCALRMEGGHPCCGY